MMLWKRQHRLIHEWKKETARRFSLSAPALLGNGISVETFFISISSTPFLFPFSKKFFFEFVVVTKMLEVDSKMFFRSVLCVVTGGMFCVPAIIFFHLFSFFDIHAPIFFVEGEK